MSANDMDIRRVRRLLRETARIAEHASLTGSLEKGSRLAIRQYNAILEHLKEVGAVPEGLFPDLDEDESSFDELGVAAKLLDGYLDDDDSSECSENGGTQKRVEIRLGGAAGLGNLGDLKNLGELIRSHMPEILREHMGCTPTPPAPPTPPTPPTPPAPPSPAATSEVPSGAASGEATAGPQVRVEISDLIEKLRDAQLSEADRAHIASEIVRLAQEG